MRARQASRILAKVFDDAFRPLGIQSSQLAVLVGVTMFGESGATLAPLARAMAMDPTTLTRNVRPLENAGLLRIARSPSDARARVVVLTRKGERMIESAFPLWERTLERLIDTFGAAVVDEVRAGLGRVVAAAGGFAGRR